MPGKNSFQKYRIAPLVGAGAVILVVLVLLALLIWALAAFAGQRDPAQSGATAAIIYLGAVFVSCLLMTLLIRGGTVIPSAILGLLAAIVSLLLAPAGAPFGKIVLKIVLTLLVAVAGFAVGKFWSGPRPERKQAQPERKSESLSTWDENSSFISEPGKGK